MDFKKVPGPKPGKFKYLYGGFIYNEVKDSKETKFTCVNYNTQYLCTAKLKKTDTGYEGDLSEHNHVAPSPYKDKENLRNTVEFLTLNSTATPSEIINILKKR